MTGPINFNPFKGVGAQNIGEIQDRRQSLRFPDIDMSPIDLNMNQGPDEEGVVALDNMDFKLNKEIPKQ